LSHRPQKYDLFKKGHINSFEDILNSFFNVELGVNGISESNAIPLGGIKIFRIIDYFKLKSKLFGTKNNFSSFSF